MVSGPVGRSGEVILSWLYSSEGKKGNRDQSEKRSWEEKDCRRREEEEKENVGVPLTALGQDASREYYSFGGHWGITDHRI